MRIKRSHLDSLNFVVGTLLTCFLVVSISSNLQAHPIVEILDQKGQPIENFSVKGPVSACERELVSSDDARAPLPVEREIASALEPYVAPVTESIEMVMDDDCAREKSIVPFGEEEDTESLNALLNTIDSAVNFQKPVTACQVVDPVFDVPSDFYTQSIAAY
jgi:hypothetical protein